MKSLALALVVLLLAGGVSVGACLETCEDDGPDGGCAPTCDDCVCCVGAAAILAEVPGAEARLAGRREPSAPPVVLPGSAAEILHVPRPTR